MNISPQYAERVEALRLKKRQEREGSESCSEIESASSTRDLNRVSNAGVQIKVPQHVPGENHDIRHEVRPLRGRG